MAVDLTSLLGLQPGAIQQTVPGLPAAPGANQIGQPGLGGQDLVDDPDEQRRALIELLLQLLAEGDGGQLGAAAGVGAPGGFVPQQQGLGQPGLL